jgi:hypothetical protein
MGKEGKDKQIMTGVNAQLRSRLERERVYRRALLERVDNLARELARVRNDLQAMEGTVQDEN